MKNCLLCFTNNKWMLWYTAKAKSVDGASTSIGQGSSVGKMRTFRHVKLFFSSDIKAAFFKAKHKEEKMPCFLIRYVWIRPPVSKGTACTVIRMVEKRRGDKVAYLLMERKRSVICSLWNMKRLVEERGRAITVCHKARITTEISDQVSAILTFICHGHLWKVFHNCTWHCMLRFPTSTQSWQFCSQLNTNASVSVANTGSETSRQTRVHADNE